MMLGIFIMLCAVLFFLGWLIDEVKEVRKAIVALSFAHQGTPAK